ncbi:DNA-binding MarR family transcriptional regulator [Geomicrobium halophilum]|uniref:DNA-binding MarR family transcriptional regulator n=1 Tax=Geomicrobium halophilum TaxID=549000 RepID=A0A841PVK5_9BACL|nr:MarR family transcriptional regulator [Geomicrobium halophilum]MBB6451216.1 DNA-binding MarR family transcriptional regulator [Geomicrobium halophilum]
MPLLSKREKQRGVLLWFRLARFYNLSVKKSNQHLEQFGLTTAQFDILAQVGAHQPITQKGLAKKLLVTKGNVTQLLKKMEERGLVTRRKEWKTKYITLTESGEKYYNESVTKQEHFQASQFKALTDEEQKQLLILLKKLQKQEDVGEWN